MSPHVVGSVRTSHRRGIPPPARNGNLHAPGRARGLAAIRAAGRVRTVLRSESVRRVVY